MCVNGFFFSKEGRDLWTVLLGIRLIFVSKSESPGRADRLPG